jgi:hypothetical protein
MRNDFFAIFLLAIAAMGLAACTHDTIALNPDHAVLFPADKASLLARTCSRTAPGPIEATWTPTPEQIAELETELPAVFQKEAHKEVGPSPNIESYYLLYGGLQIGGKRIIYVNASGRPAPPSKEQLDRASRLPPGSPLRNRLEIDWHTSPIIFCDDGASGFGVEYDTATNHFSNFEFDDCMCTRVPPPPKQPSQ